MYRQNIILHLYFLIFHHYNIYHHIYHKYLLNIYHINHNLKYESNVKSHSNQAIIIIIIMIFFQINPNIFVLFLLTEIIIVLIVINTKILLIINHQCIIPGYLCRIIYLLIKLFD